MHTMSGSDEHFFVSLLLNHQLHSKQIKNNQFNDFIGWHKNIVHNILWGSKKKLKHALKYYSFIVTKKNYKSTLSSYSTKPNSSQAPN